MFCVEKIFNIVKHYSEVVLSKCFTLQEKEQCNAIESKQSQSSLHGVCFEKVLLVRIVISDKKGKQSLSNNARTVSLSILQSVLLWNN